jgi:hypothetical protein
MLTDIQSVMLIHVNSSGAFVGRVRYRKNTGGSGRSHLPATGRTL